MIDDDNDDDEEDNVDDYCDVDVNDPVVDDEDRRIIEQTQREPINTCTDNLVVQNKLDI